MLKLTQKKRGDWVGDGVAGGGGGIIVSLPLHGMG